MQILLDHGYKNVYPLQGGFGAWLDAGYPLEPKSLDTIDPDSPIDLEVLMTMVGSRVESCQV